MSKSTIEDKIKLQNLKLNYIKIKGNKYKKFRMSDELKSYYKNLNDRVCKLLQKSIEDLKSQLPL